MSAKHCQFFFSFLFLKVFTEFCIVVVECTLYEHIYISWIHKHTSNYSSYGWCYWSEICMNLYIRQYSLENNESYISKNFFFSIFFCSQCLYLPSAFLWHFLKLIGSHIIQFSEDYDMKLNVLMLHLLLEDNYPIQGRINFRQHSYQLLVDEFHHLL